MNALTLGNDTEYIYTGMDCAGIAEASWQSLNSLKPIEIGLASSNVILTGGNVKFHQFKERFYNELRPFIPDLCDLNVRLLNLRT